MMLSYEDIAKNKVVVISVKRRFIMQRVHLYDCYYKRKSLIVLRRADNFNEQYLY